jgi:diguanylate cyclase (GGDEF)-like protein
LPPVTHKTAACDPPASIRVLLIEDSADDAAQVLRILKRGGYSVRHERVESLAAMRTALDGLLWDIVICDFRMPGFGGQAALALLRERDLEMPFIIVSGTIGEETAVEMMKAGASDYVMKSNLTRLVPAVQRELRDIRVRRAHMQAEIALRESEERCQMLFDSIDEGFCIVEVLFDELEKSIDCRFLQNNPSFEKQTELRGATGKLMRDLVPAADEFWIESYGTVALTGQPIRFRTNVEQVKRWFDVYAFRVGEPKLRQVAIRFSDVTEKAEAEMRIRRLNRLYAVLSGVNSLIVRGHARDKLYGEACKMAVEVGGFKMVWIGVIDPQTLEGKVIARFGGLGAHVENVKLTARADTADSEQNACRALRHAQAVLCNDVAADLTVSTANRDELLAAGYRSSAYFPLTIAGTPVAVLALFSDETNVFDPEETRLLSQMAGDISFALDHLEKSERLHSVAFYDLLTGLANRLLFLERVNLYMTSAVSGNHKLALCLFDIERFKNINDTYGRPIGDILLKQVAQWLVNTCGGAMTLARVGADLFAVVLTNVAHEEDVARLIERALEDFMEHTFQLGEHEFRLAAKVGVAIFPDDGANVDSMYANAEVALKKAKASGDRYLFYAQKMIETVAGRVAMEFQLRIALKNREFRLHYQPKISLVTGRLTGAEALIRWLHPTEGLVPPNRFIPLLEETGLIFGVGRWALQTAVADYLRWRAAGLQTGRIAVNVSALQLRNRDFIDEIATTVGVDDNAAEGLELEITESMIMGDMVRSNSTLQAIRGLGVKVAIDDFGTGFSSLSSLARLPVDTLKIDRSFIVEMDSGAQGRTIVSTIINLGHSLSLNVVAEGVETEEQAQWLRGMECDEMQGWLFSKALPAKEFEALLKTMPNAATKRLLHLGPAATRTRAPLRSD